MKEEYMRMSIRLSKENMDQGGGPFGAVIVKDGEVIAACGNSVVPDNDPTAHAEVRAIRLAAKKLGRFDLSDCEIYSSCEPCPMCYGAIHWAKIKRLYYANTKIDAGKIGFDDSFIYEEIARQPHERALKETQMMRNEAIKVFDEWEKKVDKTEY